MPNRNNENPTPERRGLSRRGLIGGVLATLAIASCAGRLKPETVASAKSRALVKLGAEFDEDQPDDRSFIACAKSVEGQRPSIARNEAREKVMNALKNKTVSLDHSSEPLPNGGSIECVKGEADIIMEDSQLTEATEAESTQEYTKDFIKTFNQEFKILIEKYNKTVYVKRGSQHSEFIKLANKEAAKVRQMKISERFLGPRNVNNAAVEEAIRTVKSALIKSGLLTLDEIKKDIHLMTEVPPVEDSDGDDIGYLP